MALFPPVKVVPVHLGCYPPRLKDTTKQRGKRNEIRSMHNYSQNERPLAGYRRG